ncbi:MAG: bifunctional serine/threonine-protein kinase/formylglycine-generating enzyme family protein [Gemmataceae bacterium]
MSSPADANPDEPATRLHEAAHRTATHVNPLPAAETKSGPDLLDRVLGLLSELPDPAGSETLLAQGRRVETGAQRAEEYEILDELGRGGMGVVYKARQPRLNRLVALKMILSGARASSGDLHRFLGEAESLAAVRHPNVVQVFACGNSGSGAFLCMEYLPGGSLADRLKRGRIASRDAAALLEKVARGVQAAHSAGIVHRDLKPGNVLFDDAGEPKVTDFGLAKRGTELDLTATGAVMGTPAYMAPEQAKGQGKLAGPAADVWALGVMLYECLCAARPFDAEESWGLMQKIVAEEPVSPRTRNPAVPRDLEVICLKCLNKEPYRRYSSAGMVADDLRRFLDGDAVTARPVSRLRRTYLWFRKHPVASVVLLSLVLLSATAAGLIERNARVVRAQQVASLTEKLRTAPPSEVAAAVSALEPFRGEVSEDLARLLSDPGAAPRARLNAACFLASSDPVAVDYLVDGLPAIQPIDLPPVIAALQPAAKMNPGRFWAKVADGNEDLGLRLRCAAALAHADPQNPEWPSTAADLTSPLVGSLSPGDIGAWATVLAPVRNHFRSSLERTMTENPEGDSGYAATGLLAALFRVDAPELVRLLERGSLRQAAILVPAIAAAPRSRIPAEPLTAHLAEDHRWNHAIFKTPRVRGIDVDPEDEADSKAERRVRAALALLATGHGHQLHDLLAASDDDRARTSFIHAAAASGIDPALLVARLAVETTPSVRQALLLTLGEYRSARLSPRLVDGIVSRMVGLYEADPDAGVHAACRWTLRQLGRDGPLDAIDRRLAAARVDEARDWFVNPAGITFSVLRQPGEVVTGTPPSEWHRDWSPLRSEESVRQLIPRDFAIATTETTVANLQSMLDDLDGRCRQSAAALGSVAGVACIEYEQHLRQMIFEFRGAPSRYFPGPEHPVGLVRHRIALCYCRWLGEREGLPEDQQCYPPIPEILFGRGLPRPDFLSRTGYRLPTEAEWEFAARAGTRTRYPHGADVRMLNKYVWHQGNTSEHSEPVGRLKPNGFGLFDVIGNNFERCHGWPHTLPKPPLGSVLLDDGLNWQGTLDTPYALRGGSFSRPHLHQRVGYRTAVLEFKHPEEVYGDTGFRIARTVPPRSPRNIPQRTDLKEVSSVRVDGSGAYEIRNVLGPVAVSPMGGTSPATLLVTTSVPPGWVRPAVGFEIAADRAKVKFERARGDKQPRFASDPSLAAKVTDTAFEFTPPSGGPPIRFKFDDAHLPPYVLVPVIRKVSPEWWVYPAASRGVQTLARDTSATWEIRYLDLRIVDSNSDSAVPTDAEWSAALARAPLASERRVEPRLSDERPPALRPGPLGVVLETELELPKGRYEFAVFSGRCNRLFVNGERVADTWVPTQSATNRAESELPGGRCRLRLETYTLGESPNVALDIRPIR